MSSSIEETTLQEIRQDFSQIASQLQKVATHAVQNQYEYPLFMMSKTALPFGELFLAPNDMGNSWYYYVTYLDFIVSHQLIDNPALFKKNYKDPLTFCCMLVVAGEKSHFVHIPYLPYSSLPTDSAV